MVDKIKAHFEGKIAGQIIEIKDFLAAHGDEKVGDINVSQVYGGMRGMLALICETSKLDPDEGIRFRGYSIPELQEKLPKYPGGGNDPLPEGIFFLMLMNEIPTDDDVRRLSNN